MTDEQLIYEFASGTAEQHETSVFMASERFVIFRIAGHKFWSGLGRPWRYAPVQYVLIRKGEHWLGHGVSRREWEGRVCKEELSKALELSEAAGKVVQ